MKKNLIHMSGAFALCAALVATCALAADKPAAADSKSGKTAPPDEAEMMKKWEAAATPGPNHKALEPLIGEWDLVTRFWMAGPDGPVMESKGTAKAHWILENRFVHEEVNGEMMGRPFHGMGVTGYDNLKKKYVSVWIDNAGTAISTSEGTADAGGKSFTLTGKMDDAMTGEKDKTIKYIIRIVSPEKRVLEMHDLSLGQKTKIGEITYTKK